MIRLLLFLGILGLLSAAASARKLDDVALNLAKAEQGDLYAIQMVTRGYDLRGNYAEAVAWAERGSRLGSAYCRLFYAKALIDGRGVSKDERAGFSLIAEKPKLFPAELAELYERGIGTPRDPIEAYAFAFSASHETCNECEEMHTKVGKLLARLRMELTTEQINVAIERAYSRDPGLRNEVWWQNAVFIGLSATLILTIATFVGAIGLGIWLGVRRRVRTQ